MPSGVTGNTLDFDSSILGSNPGLATGSIAELEKRQIHNLEDVGSIPTATTTLLCNRTMEQSDEYANDFEIE